ncbi:MAG: potassium-transporting ATPase subunit F [Rhodanobacteraceae bacterium]|nr:potassium-transporting ATPase subunit F [Rhodanobacteraceae bacterium]
MGDQTDVIPQWRVNPMSAVLLWLLVVAIAGYLLVAIVRPDKF